MINPAYRPFGLLAFLLLFPMLALGVAGCDDTDSKKKMLNVSYDSTRELYEEVNPLFSAQWFSKTGQKIAVKQSHGGSGTQTRAVMEGLGADVVTLALANDIDIIAERTGFLPANWQSRLPHNSAPYYSTVVFLVRKDNPKQVKDWGDLIQPNLQVMTPNPKTSGGARWNYLAAWAYAEKAFGGDEQKIEDFIAKLYRNVPMLDTAARGSTTNFIKRGIGDVLICWETEAYLAQREFANDGLEIIYPSLSIKAEPPVAVVDKNAARHELAEAAQAYLEFLYTPEIQQIIAKHHFRPADEAVSTQHQALFPPVPLVTIDEAFGGWKAAHEKHFSKGGVFDRIYTR